MNRNKPTDEQMEIFWGYVTGHRQERFELPDDYFSTQPNKDTQ